jgi:hypothetical protein
MSDTPDGRAFDHPDAELMLFVADEASPAQRVAVTEHIARCAECRASLRDLRETCNELAAQPLADMSDRAWDRALRDAIPPGFSRSVDRGSWRSSRAVGTGLSAAALLVAAAVLALTVATARQGKEVERLRAELRETRAMAVVALLREPESAERLRGVALGESLLADDARVAAAFVTALRSDPSPNVRLAVLDAVDGAPRHAQLVAEILQALPDEAQPAVRLAMIELLVELGGADARDVLDAVAHGDPDPAVRARARVAADRLSPRTPGVRQ